MNYAKNIPKLFFADFEQSEMNKKNKCYSRICRGVLWIWIAIFVPVVVRFSNEVSKYPELYNPTQKGPSNVFWEFNYCVPIFALMGFISALILYCDTNQYNSRKAAFYSVLVYIVSLVETYLVSNLLSDIFLQLFVLSLSMIASLIAFANVPGIVKPTKKTGKFIVAVLITLLLPIPIVLNVYLNVDLSNFAKVICDLFMKGG